MGITRTHENVVVHVSHDIGIGTSVSRVKSLAISTPLISFSGSCLSRRGRHYVFFLAHSAEGRYGPRKIIVSLYDRLSSLTRSRVFAGEQRTKVTGRPTA